MHVPPPVCELADRLRATGWVSDLFVAGSVATGDHRPGVSDIDLVALTDGPIDAERRSTIIAIHRDLDSSTATGADLGCAYVPVEALSDHSRRHPTWTHGKLVDRPVSGIVRAELVRYGFAVIGRPPATVLHPMTDDDVREAAHAELTGYWALAARRPWWFLDPTLADLGLSSMARGRHALVAGTLLTKTAAIETVRAPDWLRDDLRQRRGGRPVRSPRLSTAWFAWADVRRTTAAARRR